MSTEFYASHAVCSWFGIRFWLSPMDNLLTFGRPGWRHLRKMRFHLEKAALRTSATENSKYSRLFGNVSTDNSEGGSGQVGTTDLCPSDCDKSFGIPKVLGLLDSQDWVCISTFWIQKTVLHNPVEKTLFNARGFDIRLPGKGLWESAVGTEFCRRPCFLLHSHVVRLSQPQEVSHHTEV